MDPLPTGLPSYRTIVALDIERSTSRPDPIKGELRSKTYELFEAALSKTGIDSCHHDGFIDRGDGILALIHPVDQVPKALLLNHAIRLLSQFLTDYNASLPQHSQLQRQLRIRVVMHAGEIHYDANGCFGEALDVAFRLLDARRVKRILQETMNPLILVVSEDIYSSVVRHGYDGIDHETFYQLVRVEVAGKRYPGWIHLPDQGMRVTTQLASYRRPALLSGPSTGVILSCHANVTVAGARLPEHDEPPGRHPGQHLHQPGALPSQVIRACRPGAGRRRRRPPGTGSRQLHQRLPSLGQ